MIPLKHPCLQQPFLEVLPAVAHAPFRLANTHITVRAIIEALVAPQVHFDWRALPFAVEEEAEWIAAWCLAKWRRKLCDNHNANKNHNKDNKNYMIK